MRKVEPHEVAGMDENEFVQLNERLVHDICYRVYSDRVKKETGLEYEDLFQVGLMAMVRAKRGFKAEYGWQFSTYAFPKIRGEILRHMLLNGKVHVPRPIKEAYFKIAKAGLLKEDDEVIAETLGLSIKQVKRAKELRSEVSSINAMISEADGDATVEDWLATEHSAEDVAVDSVTVQEFVATLKPQHRRVWETYKRTNCANQQVMAKELGISQVQVSRILTSIFAQAEKYGEKLKQS